MRSPLSRTLNDLLDEVAGTNPNRPAFYWQSQVVSYGRWQEQSQAVAGALTGLGLRRGDAVGLLVSNRPEWLFAAFGAWRRGCTVVPFSTWSRTWDLEYLLGHPGLSVLVTLGALRNQNYLEELRVLVPELWLAAPGEWRSERFPELKHVVVVGDEVPRGALAYDAWLRDAGLRPWADLPPGDGPSAIDVACVLYTSGSTSRPKAVQLQHYAMIENGFNIGERQRMGSADRVWLPVPLFWSYGSSNALMATLTHGAALVLQEVFDASKALELIEHHACTVAYTLPTITQALISHPNFQPEQVRSLAKGLTIGLPEDVRKAAEVLGIRGICNIYGATETYGNCCVTSADDPLSLRMETQGEPLPGVTIRIRHPESGEFLPANTPGEIWVSGYITPGYLRDQATTAALSAAEGFFRTGDLGQLDSSGRLHFLGRISEVIKTKGINVSPLEIEEFICRHTAVAEAAVIGVADAEDGQVAVAFVVPKAGGDLSADAIRSYCLAHIARYKVPALVVICDALPKTATNKLVRKELVQEATQRYQKAQEELLS
ncbi:MAG: acyl--CoA ligase [Ardenticatenaceae bacterium]|nr:acyl--CoA ligase [Ardenticatenaceae bacterium]